MRNQFDKMLNTLNGELIQMGHMVEQAIESAIEALVHGDVEKAEKNMAYDDEIDEQEKTIETLCMKLLMKQQPVARDLRFISAAMKMVTDMERIGDHAADISELSITLAKEKDIPMMEQIKRMSKETMEMVVKSIEAFVSRDIDTANAVIARDDVVDALYVEVVDSIVAMIRSGSTSAAATADLIIVAKYFERIGDHATNIAEWVIFAINGTHPSIDMSRSY